MLQIISLTVCIKKATKWVIIFPSQNDEWALDVGVGVAYLLIKLFIIPLSSFLKISLENHIFYGIKNASLLLFCHVYHPNINHHMEGLNCNELQSIQLLLRCEVKHVYAS